jgi:hypothetical protein
MIPTSGCPSRLSEIPDPVMKAAVYPACSTSRVLKPSNTPGSARISGALMSFRRRLPGLSMETPRAARDMEGI